MEDSEPGDESPEGARREERLERGRGRKDDPVHPEPAPRGQDEEEPRLQEVEAENDLQCPAGTALGHPGIVGGERGGIRVQPRGEELLCGASPERDAGGGEEGEDGALSDLAGGSERGAGAERGTS